jgi:hypothetical protein
LEEKEEMLQVANLKMLELTEELASVHKELERERQEVEMLR